MSSRTATTVLIVDDSAEDRHVVVSFLRGNKDFIYTFLEADLAEGGLRTCRQANIDCIILDYNLPDMNGLQFLERLQAESCACRPPVVMVTGRGSESVAVAALRAGSADYLVKSDITPQSVYRATRNALEVGQLNRSLARETKERDSIETELRESEARYRMLVESVRDYAIMLLDTDGKINSWNTGARKLFGFHDYEVLGQHVRRLYPAEAVRSHDPETDLDNARNGISTPSERWLLRKDGVLFLSAGALSPVFDHFGRLSGYSKVIRDATQQIEASQRSELLASAQRAMTKQIDTLVARPLLRLQQRIDKLIDAKFSADADDLQMCAETLAGVCKSVGGLAETLNTDLCALYTPAQAGHAVTHASLPGAGRDKAEQTDP